MAEEPDFAIMACRPVDANDVPSAIRAEYLKMEEELPLGEGWNTNTCVACNMRVKVGPLQLAKMADTGSVTRYVVMDLMCAMKTTKATSLHTRVYSLGGS